ncbi:MFS transporter [Streptococcus chenjunshii]|uniref:MFS transporter n=1 Tax=Streptococcus chenjunshii TaxID=2173853 RepID=A0A372KL02_9STRE|nr:MFS transporter [Streptococcus chenjunshii]AXQ79204.1 MFS transporter [Streptococcus chenjunshii]RFU50776.1 MFS transporter [Streptococcus chenjunshii]RFU52957.1 MFS transporter [Streptococcus chenjunshii]
MEKKYFPTALSLYINYIIHGIGVIIISQNSDALALQWHTDTAGVMTVVSMLGIGRLIAIVFSGYLSDLFGRKPFVFLGIASYVLYFLGLIYAPNITVAMILTVIAGIANSFLDSGTYPALMESFPKHAGTATVLIKAAVQIGQWILPWILILASTLGMYQLSFYIAAIVLILNAFWIWKVPFPDEDAKAAEAAGEEKPEETTTVFKAKPNMFIEGAAFVVYGFISQATFYTISQFISAYAKAAAGMSNNAASLLLSYYSTGTLICVAFTALVGLKIRPVNLVLPYTFMSMIAIGAMTMFPSATVLVVGSVLVGFFAAGGVMQLGLTVMGEMFPAGKGTITSIFYTFGSIASFAVPFIGGRISIQNVMWMDTIFAVIGFVIAVIVFIRYYQTIDTKASK